MGCLLSLAALRAAIRFLLDLIRNYATPEAIVQSQGPVVVVSGGCQWWLSVAVTLSVASSGLIMPGEVPSRMVHPPGLSVDAGASFEARQRVAILLAGACS
jgi:hypothetical protein